MIIQPLNANLRGAVLPYMPGPGAITAQASFFQAAFPLKFLLLQGKTAIVPAGDYFEHFGRNQLAIQVKSTNGVFNASILVEGTLNIDTGEWSQIATISAEGITQYSGLYDAIRVSITAYTSGTIDVYAISQKV